MTEMIRKPTFAYAMHFRTFTDWDTSHDCHTREEYPIELDACPDLTRVTLEISGQWVRECEWHVEEYLCREWHESLADGECEERLRQRLTWESEGFRTDDQGLVSECFRLVDEKGEVEAVMVIRQFKLD